MGAPKDNSEHFNAIFHCRQRAAHCLLWGTKVICLTSVLSAGSSAPLPSPRIHQFPKPPWTIHSLLRSHSSAVSARDVGSDISTAQGLLTACGAAPEVLTMDHFTQYYHMGQQHCPHP